MFCGASGDSCYGAMHNNTRSTNTTTTTKPKSSSTRSSKRNTMRGQRSRNGRRCATPHFTITHHYPLTPLSTSYRPRLRANAIFLQGTPISHLPQPVRSPTPNTLTPSLPRPRMGKRPNTHTRIPFRRTCAQCLCLFTPATEPTSASADANLVTDHDAEGFVTVEPIPTMIWLPETRINSSLGVSEGLRGVLKMRWGRLAT